MRPRQKAGRAKWGWGTMGLGQEVGEAKDGRGKKWLKRWKKAGTGSGLRPSATPSFWDDKSWASHRGPAPLQPQASGMVIIIFIMIYMYVQQYSIKSAPVGLISTKLRLQNIQCNNSVYVIGKLDTHKPQKLTGSPSPRLILPGMQIKAIITEQRLGSKLLHESQPCSTYYFYSQQRV